MKTLVLLTSLLVSLPLLADTSAPQERLKAIASDPEALRKAIDAGKKVTFFCVNCHGENGISKIPEVPNLAGQNSAYLLEQIRKFGAGERKNQFMQGLIKVLKDEERLQAAYYYSSIAVPPSAADPSLAARGKELFTKLCVRCHGERAHGDELTPRLAGQRIAYLQASIRNYRDGNGIRNNTLMSIATSVLKNDDVTAVAHYLTQLP